MLSKQVLTVIPLSIRTIRKLQARLLENGLTFQQYRILFLTAQGHSQTEMSEILQVSMAAISKMADMVIKKQLVMKVQGEDKRIATLKLTPTGKKITTKMTGKLEGQIDQKLKTLTKKELTQLSDGLAILEKLMRNLNEN